MRTLAILLLLAGCGDSAQMMAAPPPDPQPAAPDMLGADAAIGPDLAPSADQGQAPDLADPPDLRPPPDMALCGVRDAPCCPGKVCYGATFCGTDFSAYPNICK